MKSMYEQPDMEVSFLTAEPITNENENPEGQQGVTSTNPF